MLIASLLPLLGRYSLGLDLVAGPDETVTLTVIPRKAEGAKQSLDPAEVRPIAITATAAEIDAELTAGLEGALGQLVAARKALGDQLAEQRAAAEAAKEKAAKPKADKPAKAEKEPKPPKEPAAPKAAKEPPPNPMASLWGDEPPVVAAANETSPAEPGAAEATEHHEPTEAQPEPEAGGMSDEVAISPADQQEGLDDED